MCHPKRNALGSVQSENQWGHLAGSAVLTDVIPSLVNLAVAGTASDVHTKNKKYQKVENSAKNENHCELLGSSRALPVEIKHCIPKDMYEGIRPHG